ncbi:unnamed protein product [Schistosoma rodhaini]|uniref:E3 ubiquitin-protein ligase KCMF1 n=1 Tax=Schistosoma rodhaini TaxID=6188 RepID=A0AA85FR44_9TREM|nr:unnamed protein product [Schistosoma rodhaini]
MSNKHEGVTCNGCSRRDFRFRRYKCLICRDYDLCGTCFDSQQESEKHLNYHPMQCLITKADHNVFYSGESSTKYCVQSFTCSVCGQLGFTESSLSSHVFTHHPNAIDSEVLCPFCAIQTEGDPNRTTHDIANHFKSVHNLQPSVSGNTIPSSQSANNHPTTPISEVVSLRTRFRNRSVSYDQLKNAKKVIANTVTSQHHFSSTDRSRCHNQHSISSNHIISQSLSSNSRFTAGCIVAMKNYLECYESNKNACHNDDTNGLLDQSTDSLLHNKNEITRNSSTALHYEHDINALNSQSEVDKLNNHVGDMDSQSPVVESSGNPTNYCTSTVSVIQNSRPTDSPIPSFTENMATTGDQTANPNIDSNSNLDSFTSQVFDHKVKSINTNSSKHSKSLSVDLHMKSSNDEKSKESNKKHAFSS